MQVEEPSPDRTERRRPARQRRGEVTQHLALVAGVRADRSFVPRRRDQAIGEGRARIVVVLVQMVRVFRFRFEIGNDLPGLGTGVHGYDDPEEQLRIVARLVRDLNRRGFDHHDIVVLTCRGVANSVFSTCEKVGNLRLRRFTGDYDLFGNQLLTNGQLAFDSVYRFKGQEAPAVILVDVDPNPDRMDREQRLLYCGMTRAAVRLELVVNRANDAYARLSRV